MPHYSVGLKPTGYLQLKSEAERLFPKAKLKDAFLTPASTVFTGNRKPLLVPAVKEMTP